MTIFSIAPVDAALGSFGAFERRIQLLSVTYSDGFARSISHNERPPAKPA
jgi:hypothetical protein